MKLAHLADLHLGFRQFERQTPRGGNQREADVAEAFQRAADDLVAQRPDLIVLAGDIFHSVRPTNPAILFLFKQLQRLRAALPESPIVMIAGNHDTPRSVETGAILKLYEALGVHVVVDRAQRLEFPKLDCSVLAVPHQALAGEERPALRPEGRGGATLNVLLLHGEVEGVIGEDRSAAEYGGVVLTRQDLSPAQWDYVALGHYHVAHEVAANARYSGSLEYVSTNPWGELREEAAKGVVGKGYWLVELPGARATFRPIRGARRLIDLPAVQGAGLTAQEVDRRIAQRVADAEPGIDAQIVRLVVYDVSRATARDLDHTVIRQFKARALNFQLDIRRPEQRRAAASGAPARRHTLVDAEEEFLSRRPLDADLDRAEFVKVGLEYLERAGRADAG